MIKKINYVLFIAYLIFTIYYVSIIYSQIINLSNSNGGFIFVPFLLVIHFAIFIILISSIIYSASLIVGFSVHNIVSLKSALGRLSQHFSTLGCSLIGLFMGGQAGQNENITILFILGISIIILSIYEFFLHYKNLSNSAYTQHNISQENIIDQSTETPFSTQPLNIIKNESIQLKPKQSESMVNSDNLKKTDPIQSIQEYYQTTSIDTKPIPPIKNHVYSHKTLRIIISVFLVLGFLGFAFLSLGGIVVGDLTVSAVLMVALIITIIDALLFYFLWRK